MPNSLFPDRAALTALFGSVLKGTARPDSDVDLLVEFVPDAKPSLFTLVEIEQELSELLGGRRVDLRTAQELSRYFRDDVLLEAELQMNPHDRVRWPSG